MSCRFAPGIIARLALLVATTAAAGCDDVDGEKYIEQVECIRLRDATERRCPSVEQRQAGYRKPGNCDETDDGPFVEGPFAPPPGAPGSGTAGEGQECCYIRQKPTSLNLCTNREREAAGGWQ